MSNVYMPQRAGQINSATLSKQSNLNLYKCLAVSAGVVGLMAMTISVERSMTPAYMRYLNTGAFIGELGTPLMYCLGSFVFTAITSAMIYIRHYCAAILSFLVVLFAVFYSSPAQLDAISMSKDNIINNNEAAIERYNRALKARKRLENWFIKHKVPNLEQAQLQVSMAKTNKRYRSTKARTPSEITKIKSRRFCKHYARLVADLTLAQRAIFKRSKLAKVELIILEGRPTPKQTSLVMLAEVSGVSLSALKKASKLNESFGIDFISFLAFSLASILWRTGRPSKPVFKNITPSSIPSKEQRVWDALSAKEGQYIHFTYPMLKDWANISTGHIKATLLNLEAQRLLVIEQINKGGKFELGGGTIIKKLAT